MTSQRDLLRRQLAELDDLARTTAATAAAVAGEVRQVVEQRLGYTGADQHDDPAYRQLLDDAEYSAALDRVGRLARIAHLIITERTSLGGDTAGRQS